MHRLHRRVRKAVKQKRKAVSENDKKLETYWRATLRKKVVQSPELESEEFGVELDLGRRSLSRVRSDLIQKAQKEVYGDEIALLEKDEMVLRKSPLYKLRPCIDEDGTLVVMGRFDATHAMSKKTVLPKGHKITKLVVKDLHERKLSHVGGITWLHNEVKKVYWTPDLRNLIRRLLESCYHCRRRYPYKYEQSMAPMHHSRMPGDSKEGIRPFSFQSTELT